MTNLTELAIKAALKAGKRIMEIYDTEDFDVNFKSDDSPLTKADVASHNIIVKELETLSYPILSEEGQHLPYEDRKNWNQLWIVDPIDGTKEFIKRNGEFTVNIAFVDDQVPTIGVIYVPAQNILYFANAEIGAFKLSNPSEDFSLEQMLANAEKMPLPLQKEKFTIVASRSHLSPETQEFIDTMKEKHGDVETISKGSSLKLCMVAEGVADCYPRFAPTMEWDTAAGNAICLAAGFDVIDQGTGENMLYNRKELLNNWFLVK
ncbi:3'(2'),5'-bisphosphate nucleotidase CysQ [Tamlana sp. 2_MG-2023]|uniref:3'(2'),5'-bisphosphate nucleotidase CysQ n=1 Tax=unclassified Tamlana TaxID=2614803 RepID=UPI0026E44D27|nr:MULTISPECIES: 3'(2'),5'-bisphosphate nucleotidase CysQ [unclassified Tamlana]MDO6760231.1 3'(2'),5'-bisphosphate nucleotidase CysQ [Tamlana sp. 2_MG-2023]MDO6790071.1 3'(2'),5'-bisphosphate nucleotidase CysQ [Tamlana sp. 1_MG-2023]